MAIDKEQLLQYYQTHYLSRREVLFKLPLNLSIETFWPELLRRRKANATILPLSDNVGRPYWFVLTDRMVAASELLCEEALRHEELFDPYRASMTGAMTEEMFFTSFVEGAPIQLQEAMDFLQRGTEPESIYEQIIWNNRQAHSDMMRSIFNPLNENQVKSLAFTLTEGMDNCAEDYRQTDGHPIVAMGTENYEVLSADVIPERMREYYDFLAQPDIHPLIKAAIGQAYLLVSRPFPEGNERLSRMISFAVLLRSGYDFFRDISISSMIARESYSYYKAMCDILRSENGCDLTYFAEYYLDLLVRAFNAKKDRDRKKEEDALASERELAKQPLRRETMTPSTTSNETKTEAAGFDIYTVDTQQPSEDVIDVITDMPAAAATDREEETCKEHDPETFDFWEALSKFETSLSDKRKHIGEVVRELIDKGIMSFTRAQWMDYAGHDFAQSKRACDLLLSRHIIVNIGLKKTAIYRITLDWREEKPNRDAPAISVPEPIADTFSPRPIADAATPRPLDMTHFSYDPGEITDEYVETLEKMASSNNEPKQKRIGTFLLSRLRDKRYTFGSNEYMSCYASLSDSVLKKVLLAMQREAKLRA